MVADETGEGVGHSRGEGNHRGGGEVQLGRFEERFGELAEKSEVSGASITSLTQLRERGGGKRQKVAQ